MKLIIVHKDGVVEEFDNLDSVEGAPAAADTIQCLLLRATNEPTIFIPLEVDRCFWT